jgi:hypothetical protein
MTRQVADEKKNEQNEAVPLRSLRIDCRLAYREARRDLGPGCGIFAVKQKDWEYSKILVWPLRASAI